VAEVIGIDHVIVAVDDLEAATTLFSAGLGFHISGGGVHPQFGTANRIIVLEDEYIELLAPQPGARPRGLVGSLLNDGVGCLACIPSLRDPQAYANGARVRGFAVGGPQEGRLEAVEGFSRGWKTVALPDKMLPGTPFCIKHDCEGVERRRLLAGPVGPAPHANGAAHIAGITLAVEDCHASAERFQQVLGLSGEAEGRDSMLIANTITLRLLSGAAIVLAAPSEPGKGPIAAALAQRGESMFAVTIAVKSLAEVVVLLRGRGIGVRVDEPGGVLVAAQIHQRSTLGARIGLVGV
jgi:catechol 2,3-dioxygenase-like lactoylglutathione lyase family enzyme